jgi:hypothetical protein
MSWIATFLFYVSISSAAPLPYFHCPLTPQETAQYKATFNQKLSVKVSCNPMSVDKLCAQSNQACKQTTGDQFCFSGLLTKPNCPNVKTITEAELKTLRSNNFTYMEARFRSIKLDKVLQERCCGTNEFCKKGFAATELVIKDGLGREELIGRIRLSNATMEVSIAQIGSCRNTECLEGLLIHEMGHVCHARQKQTTAVYSQAPLQTVENVKADLKYYLGEKGADCVTKSLQNRARVADPKVVGPAPLVSWAEEAYADAVFIGSIQPSRIAYLCGANEDSDHAQPKTYMGCFVENKMFRDKFCIDAGPSTLQGRGAPPPTTVPSPPPAGRGVK